MQSWRGKKQISAGKLLVELWKNEESNMGVTRDKTGKMAGKYYFDESCEYSRLSPPSSFLVSSRTFSASKNEERGERRERAVFTGKWLSI